MNTQSSFFKFLEQPYPFYYEGKKLMEISGMIFLIGMFFNYLLQPFDVNTAEHKMNYFWICVIHSSSCLPLLVGMAAVLKLFPKTTDHWKVKKEFVFILSLVILTGITQFLLRDIIYTNPDNWSWRYFKEEVLNTLIAGVFLAPILISINLHRRQLRNTLNANRISAAIHEAKEPESHTIVTIETEVKSEKFSFDSTSFIYAKAEGNYAEIYLQKESEVSKLIKRISLKSLETQLSGFSFIIKTHRSVLLNVNCIENVSGNAQGYKVQLKNCSETVPVSRNYIPSFEKETVSA
ncbi:LytTR family DNA-binding domain-containing protein [Flavobacterium sp.]|uniref:LytR/AlgR family response regulator transcription factor n=1 Tax=Flavobacterium sp. TaxID=239 RepID=UPI002607A103|nr:LytTR family DNA-binding domain-containing protein [Flavobacterium sp.]